MPDAGNINGSPETAAAKFCKWILIYQKILKCIITQLMFTKVNSFANYRTPYWRTLSDLSLFKRFL
jgi:iron complex outermembrane receptor protein